MLLFPEACASGTGQVGAVRPCPDVTLSRGLRPGDNELQGHAVLEDGDILVSAEFILRQVVS